VTAAVAWAIEAALIVHVVLALACLWRVWFASTPVDRLIAVDVVGTLLLAILVLLAIRERLPMLLDVAIGLAAVGFTGSILLARLIADDRAETEADEARR
jgi:multicomponent Na+:H+ antiporter subunit F